MTTTTKQEENIFEPIDYKHKKGILDFDFLHAVSKWVNMPMDLDGIFSECTLFSKHRNRKLMFGLSRIQNTHIVQCYSLLANAMHMHSLNDAKKWY